MSLGIPIAARIAVAAQLCAIGFAFQRSPGPIEMIPRNQQKGPESLEPGMQPVVRVNSSLVLIPVHVTTAAGSSVTSLKKEEFVLFEDGVQQRITTFAQDDAPISVGLLLDISNSMKSKMAKASEAATEFFKFANPEDEFFLVEFNEHAHLKVPFTRDWSQISAEIAGVKAKGLTAMLDGIHLAVAQMKHARHVRKALILITDGGDNFSHRSLRELKARLIEADVQVYALGVFDSDYSRKHTPEERNGPKLLDQVALDTGGRDYPVFGADNLPAIGKQIARELRNQYLLGFSPAASTADGKFHRVDLKLAPLIPEDGLRAYYRQGYYAPEH